MEDGKIQFVGFLKSRAFWKPVFSHYGKVCMEDSEFKWQICVLRVSAIYSSWDTKVSPHSGDESMRDEEPRLQIFAEKCVSLLSSSLECQIYSPQPQPW